MRRKLKKRYPNLDSHDNVQRSFSTSDFLHDFVLDFGPGIVKPNMFAPPPPSPPPVPPGEPSRYARLTSVDDDREGLPPSWNDKSPGVELDSFGRDKQARIRIRSEEYTNHPDFDPADLEYGRK